MDQLPARNYCFFFLDILDQYFLPAFYFRKWPFYLYGGEIIEQQNVCFQSLMVKEYDKLNKYLQQNPFAPI